MASNEEKFITIDDTPVNRYKKFIIYGITYFNLMVSTELSMAKSKDNVKANKYLNYSFLRSRKAGLARGQTNTPIIRSCAPAKRGWRESKKYHDYSFLRSREAC